MYVAGGSSKLNPVIRWAVAEKLAVVQGLLKTYLNQVRTLLIRSLRRAYRLNKVCATLGIASDVSFSALIKA
jgi:hypothetical protein